MGKIRDKQTSKQEVEKLKKSVLELLKTFIGSDGGIEKEIFIKMTKPLFHQRLFPSIEEQLETCDGIINFIEEELIKKSSPLWEREKLISRGLNEMGRSRLNYILDWIKEKRIELMQANQAVKKNNTRPLYSYKWQGNPKTELPILYKKMLNVFIAPKTTLEQFIAIFDDQPTNSIERVTWLATRTSTKSLLAYFIEQAVKANKIVNADIWATAKLCFTGASNLRQAQQLYLNNKKGKPKNHYLIDALFE